MPLSQNLRFAIDDANTVITDIISKPFPSDVPITLIGNSFYEINAVPLNGLFTINPIDNNGNVWDNVTVVVNNLLSDITLILPSITEGVNNQLGFRLTVVLSVGTSFAAGIITIQAGGTDTIGSLNAVTLSLGGSSAILSPVSQNIWSCVITI